MTSYLDTLSHESTYVFPSRKRGESDAHIGPVGQRR